MAGLSSTIKTFIITGGSIGKSEAGVNRVKHTIICVLTHGSGVKAACGRAQRWPPWEWRRRLLSSYRRVRQRVRLATQAACATAQARLASGHCRTRLVRHELRLAPHGQL